jgi:hypothetical protein
MHAHAHAHLRLSSLELPLPLECDGLWDSIRSTSKVLATSRDTLAYGDVLRARMSMRLARSARMLATAFPSAHPQGEPH